MKAVLGAMLIAVLFAACTREQLSTATPALTEQPSRGEPATLTITGSGKLCGPWWFGCGAALVIEAPEWDLPANWRPGVLDTVFDVDLRIKGDLPARITGVWQPGRDRIAPGDYTVVGIATRSPDNEPGTLESSVACSEPLHIPSGTHAVTIAVAFGKGGGSACTIAMSIDGRTAGNGP